RSLRWASEAPTVKSPASRVRARGARVCARFRPREIENLRAQSERAHRAFAGRAFLKTAECVATVTEPATGKAHTRTRHCEAEDSLKLPAPDHPAQFDRAESEQRPAWCRGGWQ